MVPGVEKRTPCVTTPGGPSFTFRSLSTARFSGDGGEEDGDASPPSSLLGVEINVGNRTPPEAVEVAVAVALLDRGLGAGEMETSGDVVVVVEPYENREFDEDERRAGGGRFRIDWSAIGALVPGTRGAFPSSSSSSSSFCRCERGGGGGVGAAGGSFRSRGWFERGTGLLPADEGGATSTAVTAAPDSSADTCGARISALSVAVAVWRRRSSCCSSSDPSSGSRARSLPFLLDAVDPDRLAELIEPPAGVRSWVRRSRAWSSLRSRSS